MCVGGGTKIFFFFRCLLKTNKKKNQEKKGVGVCVWFFPFFFFFSFLKKTVVARGGVGSLPAWAPPRHHLLLRSPQTRPSVGYVKGGVCVCVTTSLSPGTPKRCPPAPHPPRG